jgi:uncharacterized protein YdaU (DUF1376 family)
MSLQERGAYITLICLCWTEGSLPSDANRLARLCGIPSTMFRKLWPAIAVCFRDAGDDRLIHPRLEREREKQTSYRRRQSDAATLRWSQRHATAVASYSQATSEPMPEPSHRNALLSSSSSVDLKTSSEPTSTAPEPKDNFTLSADLSDHRRARGLSGTCERHRRPSGGRCSPRSMCWGGTEGPGVAPGESDEAEDG